MKQLLNSLNYNIDVLIKEIDTLNEHQHINSNHSYTLEFIDAVIASAHSLLYYVNDKINEENELIIAYKILFNKFIKNPNTKTCEDFIEQCPQTLSEAEIKNYLNILSKYKMKYEEKEEYLKCANICTLETYLQNIKIYEQKRLR